MPPVKDLLESWIVGPQRMSNRERRANIDGLNIVFGAVLGFVLASTETMDSEDFSLTLLYSAMIVVLILYVTHSRYRVAYSVIATITVATLPFVFDAIFDGSGAQIPAKLQPTFAVWLAMTIFIEFWPKLSRPVKRPALPPTE